MIGKASAKTLKTLILHTEYASCQGGGSLMSQINFRSGLDSRFHVLSHIADLR